MSSAIISGLFSYPIKSCAGIAVAKTECDDFGIKYDRTWAIVDTDRTILTQRNHPRMALIQPTVNKDGSLLLEAPPMTPLTVSPTAEGRQRLSLKVWADESAGFDQGDQAAAWLTEFLGVTCRLLRNDREFARLTKLTKPNGESARVAFADGYPLLVVSEESLADLNARLGNQVLMSRFRPSIVLSGLGPYGEDHFSQLSSPEIVLHAAKPCPRCVLITIDQESGASSAPEPLRTLSNYRHNGEKVLFGYYFLPDSPGELRVGNRLKATALSINDKGPSA